MRWIPPTARCETGTGKTGPPTGGSSPSLRIQTPAQVWPETGNYSVTERDKQNAS